MVAAGGCPWLFLPGPRVKGASSLRRLASWSDWRRVSRSSCDWGQLILMALRLLSRTAVFCATYFARHCSEPWSCGPEESSGLLSAPKKTRYLARIELELHLLGRLWGHVTPTTVVAFVL